MEKLIVNDLFCVAYRLKKIDRDYCVYFSNNKYYAKYKNQFAFSIGTKLDCLALKKALYTHIRRKKIVLSDLEQNNKRLLENENRLLREKSLFDLEQKILFADKKGGVINFDKANSTRWI